MKIRAKSLEDLLEQKRKVTYDIYEFDEPSYTCLLCDIRTMLRENQELKNQLEATKEVALKYLKNEIELKEKLQQRENKNWNELKEWLEDNWKQSQDIWFVKIINKMQEIERL